MTKYNEVNQYTLENLNMHYIGNIDNNIIPESGAVLRCSTSWTISQLQEYLPDYDYDMLETVQHWLANDAQIAEGGYLEVWI